MKASVNIENGVHTITLEEYNENEFKSLIDLVNTMGSVYPKYVWVDGENVVVTDFGAILSPKPDLLLQWHDIHLMFENRDLRGVISTLKSLADDATKS